jgi:hypothetical protein
MPEHGTGQSGQLSMDRSPLQHERERRGWTQEVVADQLRRLGLEHGHGNLGIDANAVSRHERGIIAMPRDPYPDLYAALYGTTSGALWPIIGDMERRRFLGVLAATPVAGLLPADVTTDAVTTVTGGFRRLEGSTPAHDLRGPVSAHLRFIAGRLDRGGTRLAAAASEAAGFTAWLAVDQADEEQARRYYAQAITWAERSGSDVLAAYMLGSMSLWAADTGKAAQALRLIDQASQRLPRHVPPTVHAWTATVEAVAHAAGRDTDATFAAVKRAETAISQGHEPLWPWLLPFDQPRFAGYLGSCATRLNLARTAIPALEGALGTGRTKQRALVLADLAANHRALGHADEARTLADEARAIGVEFGSEKVLRRLAA